MTKRKKKKTTSKKHTVVKKRITKEKNPNFMVQINEPKNVRKDLLESLREVIIFMQGNETFKKIQEEKVAKITDLKEEIKEINTLLNTKLRKFLPKGKLRNLTEEEHQENQNLEEHHEETIAPRPSFQPRSVQPVKSTGDELTNLENQLKDIETQLRTIQ